MSLKSAPSRIGNLLNIDSQDGQLYLRWYGMVCRYMECYITRKSDRLSAFAGLAAEIAMRTKKKYYARLWEHGLIEGLVWQCWESVNLGMCLSIERPLGLGRPRNELGFHLFRIL